MRDRGVSEVIAFILIFSIVITSVGLLYTAGFGSLNQIQESETDRSAERAFSASAIALEDIQRGRGSYRAFDVELSGRTITVDDAATLEVRVNDTGGGTPVPVANSPVSAGGALVYGPGSGTEIAYQSGAVIRSDGPDAQIVSRPPLFQCSGNRAVLSLVSIGAPPGGSVSSDGSIQIVASQANPDESTLEVVESGASSYSVTVDYTGTPYQDAWREYFDDQPNWSVGTPSTGQATCGGLDAVYVRRMTINIDYRGI
jgi:hypothetical protein